MNARKRLIINIALISVIIIGLCIFLYPIVSNIIYTSQSQSIITTYKSSVDNLQDTFIEDEWQKAVDYNDSLMGNKPVTDPFVEGSGMALSGDYLSILNINGIMGYIDIPCVDIHLPIYHTTNEIVLKKGVGHLQSTPLPIGGEGINPILSAHTGLPKAKLFSDLINVKKGDFFSIRIMDRTMYYKVDDIQVILPDEIKSLVPEIGKDYVTLVTCTPYGINSHRLVVRGERCYEIAETMTLEKQSRTLWWTILIGSGILVLALAALIIVVLVLKNRPQRIPQE
ncbi:MAG: class C sortase [Peptococcaceae bacterium]|nr:class C sortase [Peptococcaceae bacterium]